MKTKENKNFIYQDKTYTLKHFRGDEYILERKKTGEPNFITYYDNNKIRYENWLPTEKQHELFFKKITKHKNKTQTQK